MQLSTGTFGSKLTFVAGWQPTMSVSPAAPTTSVPLIERGAAPCEVSQTTVIDAPEPLGRYLTNGAFGSMSGSLVAGAGWHVRRTPSAMQSKLKRTPLIDAAGVSRTFSAAEQTSGCWFMTLKLTLIAASAAGTANAPAQS